MHPYLYRSLLAIACSFIVLALIAFPFLKPGQAAFYANVIGVIILLVFILLITLEYRRERMGNTVY